MVSEKGQRLGKANKRIRRSSHVTGENLLEKTSKGFILTDPRRTFLVPVAFAFVGVVHRHFELGAREILQQHVRTVSLEVEVGAIEGAVVEVGERDTRRKSPARVQCHKF